MTAEITLQQLSDKIDNLARINLIGVKNDLQIEEAAMYTGLSIGCIYHLAQERLISHYKQNRRLYFNKTELDRWIESNEVQSDERIASKATTYVIIHKK